MIGTGNEIQDFATWMNILLPIAVPVITLAFVYAKKTDTASINIVTLKQDIKELRESFKDFRSEVRTFMERRKDLQSKTDVFETMEKRPSDLDSEGDS
jgi:predicted  nucleic acid-binding Zn-ribbon protein